jgi:hypothetical protein
MTSSDVLLSQLSGALEEDMPQLGLVTFRSAKDLLRGFISCVWSRPAPVAARPPA